VEKSDTLQEKTIEHQKRLQIRISADKGYRLKGREKPRKVETLFFSVKMVQSASNRSYERIQGVRSTASRKRISVFSVHVLSRPKHGAKPLKSLWALPFG
jgi:hypothetical protein